MRIFLVEIWKTRRSVFETPWPFSRTNYYRCHFTAASSIGAEDYSDSIFGFHSLATSTNLSIIPLILQHIALIGNSFVAQITLIHVKYITWIITKESIMEQLNALSSCLHVYITSSPCSLTYLLTLNLYLQFENQPFEALNFKPLT